MMAQLTRSLGKPHDFGASDCFRLADRKLEMRREISLCTLFGEWAIQLLGNGHNYGCLDCFNAKLLALQVRFAVQFLASAVDRR